MQSKKWKWFLIVAVLILAAAQLVRKTPPNIPEEFQVSNFPVFEQLDQISCGPTSCRMLLKYYGEDIKIEDIKKAAKTTWFKHDDVEIGMTTPEYIKVALDKYEVKSEIKQGNITDIKVALIDNRPPIVLLRSGQEIWHYVVVIGFKPNTIIYANPGSGKIETMPEDVFKKSWAFRSDMSGHSTDTNCPACKGTGKYLNLDGPLSSCDVCGGSGKLIDKYYALIRLADVNQYTLIVPKK